MQGSPCHDENDACGQDDGKGHLDFAHNVGPAVVQIPEQDQHSLKQGQFAGIDVPVHNGVQMAEFEDARQKKAREEHYGRGIEGDDAEIPKHKGPAANKGERGAKGRIGEGKHTSGNGKGSYQASVGKGHENQHYAASHKADD